MHCTLIAVLLAITACSGSARDDAALATNTAQSVLTAVDDIWAPIVADEIAKARTLDDAQYQARMASFTVVNDAIESARRATQLLNLAVQTWDAKSDGGKMFAALVPCVLQDVRLIRVLLKEHARTVPSQVAQALTVIEMSLTGLADPGATCTPTPATVAPMPPVTPPAEPQPEPAAAVAS